MRFTYLALLFLVLPGFVYGACLERGLTVVYVNGIFTSEETARRDLRLLEQNFKAKFPNSDVQFINGYNPSHLAGVGDVTQAALQTIGLSVSNYDLKTILLQIHPQVQTRRLLLIGHSQGGFYTNAMHEYLLAHGEPKESVGVYNIGTPSNKVAGGGKYLSSANDMLLNMVEHFSGIYLVRNINIPILPGDVGNTFAGHGISQAYLAGAPDRVVGEMQAILAALQPTYPSATGACFTPPEKSLGYQVESVLYAVADPVVSTSIAAAGAVKDATVAAAQGVYGFVASTLAVLTPEPRTENLPGSFSIVKALYGSSLTEAEVRELLGTQQGSAAVLALQQGHNLPAPLPPPPVSPGVVAGVETESPQPPMPHIPPSNLIPIPTSPGYGGGGSVAQHTPAPSAPQANGNTQESSPGVPQPEAEPEPEPGPEENTQEEQEKEEPLAEEVEEEEEPVAQPLPGEVFVLASQLDDSQHCVFDWRPCYTQDGRHAFINLGSGAQFANGSLHSVTVASDSSEWIAQVRCYTDSAYASLCPDWVTSQIWNGFTTYQTADFANVSAGGNRWTALFTEPVNHKNSDGSHPVVFRPEYYYQLVIDDDGLTNGAYGSPTTPFFILYGLAPTPEE